MKCKITKQKAETQTLNTLKMQNGQTRGEMQKLKSKTYKGTHKNVIGNEQQVKTLTERNESSNSKPP